MEKEGKLHNLAREFKNLSVQASLGIGHTRWATHGEPNEINAHPHSCPNHKIALVHNGIIENYSILKKELIDEGHIFRSETDSEVIAHLVDKYFDGNLETAVLKACSHLVGSYGIAVISEYDPDKIVVCRKSSPLIIGIGSQETFVSSDINAIIHQTKDIIYLEDNEMAVIKKDSVDFFDFSNNPIQKRNCYIELEPRRC